MNVKRGSIEKRDILDRRECYPRTMIWMRIIRNGAMWRITANLLWTLASRTRGTILNIDSSGNLATRFEQINSAS